MAKKHPPVTFMPRWMYISLTFTAAVAAIGVTFLIAFKKVEVNPDNSFYVLVIYALMIALVFFGITELIADLSGHLLGFKIKAGGTFAAFLIVILFGFLSRTLIGGDKEFKIQLRGAPGLPQQPLVNESYALTIAPLNAAEAMIFHVDGDGMARHTLPDAFFKDSVFIHVNDPRFILFKDHVKLDKDKGFQELILHAPKVHYHFIFEDANDPQNNLPDIKFSADGLHIKEKIIKSGQVIDTLVDNSGIDNLFHITISCPGYTYKGDYDLNKTVTSNVFQFVKKH